MFSPTSTWSVPPNIRTSTRPGAIDFDHTAAEATAQALVPEDAVEATLKPVLNAAK